jgi:O-antigen ligase
VAFASPRADRIYRETIPGYGSEPVPNPVVAIEERALERVPEARGVPLPDSSPIAFAPRSSFGRSRFGTISLEPSATVEAVLWYLALLSAFLLARERARSGRVARGYGAALQSLFACLAIVGLLQKATWNGKLLWVRELRAGGLPFGPYVDGAHFAGAMELAVPWLLGSAWDRFREKGWRGLREPGALFPALSAVLCAAAGVSTQSKMGSFLISAGILLTVTMSASGLRGRLAALGGATVAAFALLAAFVRAGGGERFRSFLETAPAALTEHDRLVGWPAMIGLLRDFPVTGTGFGTFPSVFPAYLLPGETRVWNAAHNDVLQVALEGGLVAAALVCWLSWGFWKRGIRAILPGRAGSSGRASACGLFMGLSSLSLHALVDFNHQIPANALLFVTLAGVFSGSSFREARSA